MKSWDDKGLVCEAKGVYGSDLSRGILWKLITRYEEQGRRKELISCQPSIRRLRNDR